MTTVRGRRGVSLLETPWAIAIDPARRDGRIVAESSEPERKAKPVAMPRSLDPGLVEALGRAGIERLYSHQREALTAATSSNLVITSGTASGKSLAFNLPVLAGIPGDSRRRALSLSPTRARAQDRARKRAALRPPGLREAIYDGDTPREERPAIRRRNNLVLTNPDMLHVGLLPHHKGWGDFLANLGWVVVDEAHTYRGVFGSHVANVLRRLRRVGRGPRAQPPLLPPSAAIAHPARLAGEHIGELDAAICVTFPGTVASLRQMWGRAGRQRRGLAVYVAGADALDQFFCRHPDEFIGRPVEAAILDHESEQIASRHMVAAAYELPLSSEDDEVFGEGWRERAGRLESAGELRRAGGLLPARSSAVLAP